jgi:hypothetical protein
MLTIKIINVLTSIKKNTYFKDNRGKIKQIDKRGAAGWNR